jgi:hypothetical protein
MYDDAAIQYLKENSGNIEVIYGKYLLLNQMLMTKSKLAFWKYFRERKSEINYDSDKMSEYLDRFIGIERDW